MTPPWLERPGSTEPAPCSRENAASPSAATAGGCLSFLSPLCYWERGAARGAFVFPAVASEEEEPWHCGTVPLRQSPSRCPVPAGARGSRDRPPFPPAVPFGSLAGAKWGLVVGSRGHVACKRVLWSPPPHCQGPAAHSSSARAAKLRAAFSTSRRGPTWSAARSRCHRHLPELCPLCARQSTAAAACTPGSEGLFASRAPALRDVLIYRGTVQENGTVLPLPFLQFPYLRGILCPFQDCPA